jgi:hypothetical protein
MSRIQAQVDGASTPTGSTMRMSRHGYGRWAKGKGQEAMKSGMGRDFLTRLRCGNTVTCFEPSATLAAS